MATNYGLLGNIAGGIREAMTTYNTIKSQQRQEQLLETQLENQRQDREMKMMQSGLVKNPETGAMEYTPEAQEQRQTENLSRQSGLLKAGHRIAKDPVTGQMKLEEIPGFKDLDTEYKKAKIKEINAKVTNVDNKSTDAQKVVDKRFAENYDEYINKGGYAGIDKDIEQLEEAKNLLKNAKTKPTKTQRAAGLLPGAVQDLVIPETKAIGDRARSVAMKNIKLFLPGPASDKDREAVVGEIFNDRQSPEENIRRLDSYISKFKEKRNIMEAQAEHYEKYGTIKGFKGTEMSREFQGKTGEPGDLSKKQKAPGKDKKVPSTQDSQDLLKELGF